jgi:hypothetical protein
MARKGPLVFVSIAAAVEPGVRQLSRKVKSYVALRQDRAGMRCGPFWSEVRETKARDETPKPGAHIVAPMRSAADRDRLVEAINSSGAYGDTFGTAATAGAASSAKTRFAPVDFRASTATRFRSSRSSYLIAIAYTFVVKT